MNVIEIENLSKEYRLGVIGHGTLTRDLQSWWARLRNKEDPNSKLGFAGIQQQIVGDCFWALRDINLTIEQGDVLGIIGKNGAGKSTLLKILSRVTAPTQGCVKVKGRIASLLEVGTGFHPELTGGENIFMNGAILGMSKHEIRSKFDEIVDFAGIEDFIDTPVKRYSSGMYVRLAFAVAAHLEPEILVVDEVLAVGDVEFQRKCLGKMGQVAKTGRTVLFVSHNMGAVNNLCKQCVCLANGSISDTGVPSVVISNYYNSNSPSGAAVRNWTEETAPGGGSGVKLLTARILQEGKVTERAGINCPIVVELRLSIEKEMPEVGVSLKITRSDGLTVIHSNKILTDIVQGEKTVSMILPGYTLNVGEYFIEIASDIPNKVVLFFEENCLQFSVFSNSIRMSRYSANTYKGVVGPFIGEWTVSSN